jgi:alpha-beta hydrolase superfamily lysophospholipase
VGIDLTGELTFTDADGIEVFYRRWLPTAPPRAAVLVVHGASEHSQRYTRAAGVLTDHGYAVYALDLRGHGRTATSTGPGRIGPRGMAGVLDDLEELARIAGRECGDVPIVLLGHSMGALVAQAFVEERGEILTAYVLSGTVGPMEGADELAAGMRQAIDAGMADEPLDILGGLNAEFEPARTPFDWLSRDPDEVDRYISDPLCGDDLPLTYGFVAEMIATGAHVMEPAGIARVPKHLRVLLLTGEADPVSDGAAQVRQLEQWLRDAGLDVTAEYYAGARHEVLNETNRAEVHDDLVTWLERVTRNTV